MGQGQKSMGKRQGSTRAKATHDRRAALDAVRRAARNGVEGEVLSVRDGEVVVRLTEIRGRLPRLGERVFAIFASE